jgi:hypothetical protein
MTAWRQPWGHLRMSHPDSPRCAAALVGSNFLSVSGRGLPRVTHQTERFYSVV